MKRQVSIAISIVIAIAFSTPSATASGMKKAGPLVASSTTINTLLTGSVPPTSSVGKNGDVYIDVKNAVLYGPKKKGIWPLGVSLKGAEGKAGTDGKNGSDGKTGAAGTVSSTSTPGPAGPQGPKGDTGPAGPAGADGANGSAGPAGPAGQPGLNGSDGAQGIQGVQGPKGDTGASGISKVIKTTIPSFTLNQTPGTGNQSTQFGNLEAGKPYEFNLILHGITTAAGNYFGIQVVSTDSAAPATYDAVVVESKTYDVSTGSSSHRYTFYVTGTITSGIAETSLIVKIVDGDGITSTAGKSMSVTGRAYFIETNLIS